MDESGKGGTAGCWLRLAHATDGNEPRRGIVNPAQTGQRAGSSGDAFSLFVDGAEDKFKDFPKVGLLDLILGESINQIRQSGIDEEKNGHAVLEQLQALREKYAGYFSEEV